ncbi:OLC1v1010095C1 [Oldenlandia corymbosa var. corymbosa]|uniref:OLC1v1010095C1 n=1 Tax=Oldenlandia corymbosa var. corymbosa TaxID=529605 RepID=A0AAV1DTN3_OLDCO|nr:OLC1v1010095C1 [Oldenlandia corymbosa var. corymbosa]
MSKWWRAAGGGLRRAIEDPKLRSYHTIQAIPREYTGHRVSVRDRGQGRIPTIVFSQNYVEKKPGDPNSIAAEPSVSRKLFLTTEKRQIKAILNSVELPFFCSTTFPLQIRAGSGSSTLIESGRVLPIKIHRNEETGEILNLVLAWAEDGKKFVVDVPIVFKGEDVCPGIQKGGYLNKVRKYLRYLCPAEHIPQKIEVDISKLDIGDKLQLDDIKVHPSLKLVSKNDVMPVCKIMAAKDEHSKDATSGGEQ